MFDRVEEEAADGEDVGVMREVDDAWLHGG